VIDRVAVEALARERAQGLLESEPFTVTLAISLGFDAVVAGWLPLVTLDAASSAG
jgi:hypothetical protein